MRAIASLFLLPFAICLGCNQSSTPRASSAPTSPPITETPAALIKPRIAPHPARTILGRSVQGTEIVAHTFSFHQSGSTDVVLVFAGIHGDEPTTVVQADRLVQLLTDSSPDATSLPRTLVVVPRLNPDGLAAKTRVNANRVDLNRNLPATNWRESRRDRNLTGPSPLSEPESRILHDLVDRLKPTRILSIHSIRAGRHGVNFDGPAEPLAQLMARHNGYAVLPTMGYPTPGSFGSWAGIDRQIPVITLELPSNMPGDKAWDVNREAILAFIRGR